MVMEEAGVIVDLDDKPTERPTISARTPIITSRIKARMRYFCPEHRKTTDARHVLITFPYHDN